MIIHWSIITAVSIILSIVVGILYLHKRFEYTSARPQWLFTWVRRCLQLEESDIGKDVELLVKKIAQVGEWMDNLEESDPLTDEIRRDIGNVEWRVWKETYSYFALYSKNEDLIKLALRNLSQVQEEKAIRRASKHLKGMKDEFDAMPPHKEVRELAEAVIKELEDLLKQDEDKEKEVFSAGFDVFMSYNTEDISFIQKLNEEFKSKGLRTWLDKEQVIPGMNWLDEICNHISNIRVACVFVGESGLGPWHKVEINALLKEFVDHGCTVIPVILPDTKVVPELPLFLHQIEWSDLRKDYEQNIQKLVNALKRYLKKK